MVSQPASTDMNTAVKASTERSQEEEERTVSRPQQPRPGYCVLGAGRTHPPQSQLDCHSIKTHFMLHLHLNSTYQKPTSYFWRYPQDVTII